MKMDASKRLFQVFDPLKSLGAEDGALYVTRAGSVVEEFLSEAHFSGGHRFVLVGAVGSGKSTELFRLYEENKTDDQRMTILLDLFKQFGVDELSAGQVVFLVALAVLQAARVDLDTNQPLLDKLRDSSVGIVKQAEARELNLGKLIQALAIVVGGVATGPAGAAVTAAASKATEMVNARLGLPGHGKSLTSNDPKTVELHQALQEALQVARKAVGGKRFLVLVDGLDKIRAERAVRDMFCTGVLPAPSVEGIDLVYAAPPSLLFRAGFGDGSGFRPLHLGLFNIFRRKGGINQEEAAQMRILLERRVHQAGLRSKDVWPDGTIEHESVGRIIEASGGLTRDLVHIMRNAIIAGSKAEDVKQLRVEDLQTGIDKHAKTYLRKLDLEIEQMLRTTARTRQRPGGEGVWALLNDNLILYYDNGTPWCRPHPLVMARLRERFGDDLSGDVSA